MSKTKVRVIENMSEMQVYGLPKNNEVICLAKEARNFYLLHGNAEEYSLHIGTKTKMKEAEIKSIVKGPASTTIEYIIKDMQGILNIPVNVDKHNKPTVQYEGETIKLEKLI